MNVLITLRRDDRMNVLITLRRDDRMNVLITLRRDDRLTSRDDRPTNWTVIYRTMLTPFFKESFPRPLPLGNSF